MEPVNDTAPVRTVTDVETLKALADPIRLRILTALMRPELPVMTVKELAAELDEPQTKLYRHVRHLETAGLIQSVASRMVSGIMEHRYQSCQSDLMLRAGLTETQKASAEAEATVAAALELYRSQFFAAHRAGLISDSPLTDADADAEADPRRRVILGLSTARVSVSQAVAIRERMQQILDDLASAEAEASLAGPERPRGRRHRRDQRTARLLQPRPPEILGGLP